MFPQLKPKIRGLVNQHFCGTQDQQTLWDWEFVALQRRLDQLTDAEAAEQLRNKFLTQLCAADRDVAFYVGNQAARPQSFSIGGVYAPRRPTARYRLHVNR